MQLFSASFIPGIAIESNFLGPIGIGLATATGPDRVPAARDPEPAPPDPAAPERPEHRMIDVTRSKVV